MTTVVNTPGTSEGGSGMGIAIGVLIVVALIVLFLIFGLPQFRGGGGGGEQNAPSEVDVNLPSDVNLDVNGVPGQPQQ